MALLGSLSTVREQSALPRLHPAAFAYLAEAFDPASEVHRRILGLPVDRTDRIELGDGIFVLEQAYFPKARPDGRFESHRRFIDLQAIIAGSERMEVIEVSRLRLSEDLTPQRDLLFYDDLAGASVLTVVPGDIAVFYPVDAHMPSLAGDTPGLVRKAVVKVPVSA